MSNASAAVRALVVDPVVRAREQRQRGRVAFAVVWVVATVVAVAADEADHCHHAVDAGFSVDNDDRRWVTALTPGGPAAVAGVIAHHQIRDDAFFVDANERAWFVGPTAQLTMWRDQADGDAGDPRWMRGRGGPGGDSFVGCVVALVLAIAAGAAAQRSKQLTSTTWEQSFVWPATAAALVVPLWAHLAMSVLHGAIGSFQSYLLLALLTTSLPHALLIVGLQRWPLVIAAIAALHEALRFMAQTTAQKETGPHDDVAGAG